MAESDSVWHCRGRRHKRGDILDHQVRCLCVFVSVWLNESLSLSLSASLCFSSSLRLCVPASLRLSSLSLAVTVALSLCACVSSCLYLSASTQSFLRRYMDVADHIGRAYGEFDYWMAVSQGFGQMQRFLALLTPGALMHPRPGWRYPSQPSLH